MIIILTFIAFTGLVALISWYKTKEENLSTKEGYFLAGRGLTGLVIAGSLEMTNLSTEQLVGQAGQSYSTNMGAMSWSVNAKYRAAGAGTDLPAEVSESRHHHPGISGGSIDRTTNQHHLVSVPARLHAYLPADRTVLRCAGLQPDFPAG